MQGLGQNRLTITGLGGSFNPPALFARWRTLRAAVRIRTKEMISEFFNYEELLPYLDKYKGGKRKSLEGQIYSKSIRERLASLAELATLKKFETNGLRCELPHTDDTFDLFIVMPVGAKLGVEVATVSNHMDGKGLDKVNEIEKAEARILKHVIDKVDFGDYKLLFTQSSNNDSSVLSVSANDIVRKVQEWVKTITDEDFLVTESYLHQNPSKFHELIKRQDYESIRDRDETRLLKTFTFKEWKWRLKIGKQSNPLSKYAPVGMGGGYLGSTKQYFRSLIEKKAKQHKDADVLLAVELIGAGGYLHSQQIQGELYGRNAECVSSSYHTGHMIRDGFWDKPTRRHVKGIVLQNDIWLPKYDSHLNWIMTGVEPNFANFNLIYPWVEIQTANSTGS